MNGLPFTIVGVAPPDFEGIEINDDAPLAVWLPLGALVEAEATPDARGLFTDRNSSGWIRTAARLAPGATLASANAELAAIGSSLRPASTDPRDASSLNAAPLEGGVDPSNRSQALPVLSLLMLVPLLVLVVACANAANILLSRSLARRKELAVRRALGASRARLVRQLLTESVILSLAAAGVGVLLSVLLTSAIARMGDIPAGIVAAFTPDVPVLIATSGVAFVAGVFFGLAPAFSATSPELTPALKSETVSIGVGRERHRLRDLLVIAQVSVALVLIVTAGLFTRSLTKAVNSDPGFTARHGLYLSFDLERQRYDAARQSVFRRDVLRTVAAVPGVRATALATAVPFGRHFEGSALIAQGHGDEDGVSAFVSSVSPDFFSTMGVPLVVGHGFTDRDDAASAPVIVINERLANQLWPGESPLGKQVKLAGGELRQVVGVTSTGKYANLVESPMGQAYVPLAQRTAGSLFLVVRTEADPATLVAAVRRTAQALDPDLPLYEPTTFEASIRGGADKQRAAAAALAVFGLLALVLTLVGVYGVTAHGVALRTREIGIRMSLGARATDVLRLFVGEGVKRSLVGIAVGVLVSAALSRVLARFLFGLTATDAMSFVVGAAVVLFGVVLASGLPARRAARVDPMTALRAE
ncbi:MAG TPA: FtsX-like permease family protein [Gemmatimonadales bacterium]|nr:FtsX-like permease family protein [Gemmatimonadales bacterium]